MTLRNDYDLMLVFIFLSEHAHNARSIRFLAMRLSQKILSSLARGRKNFKLTGPGKFQTYLPTPMIQVWRVINY